MGAELNRTHTRARARAHTHTEREINHTHTQIFLSAYDTHTRARARTHAHREREAEAEAERKTDRQTHRHTGSKNEEPTGRRTEWIAPPTVPQAIGISRTPSSQPSSSTPVSGTFHEYLLPRQIDVQNHLSYSGILRIESRI